MLYDATARAALLADPACDVIVWGVRGHPEARRHPRMFGRLATDAAGAVTGVSVKQPLAGPAHDPVIVGTFTFRRAADFMAAAERMFARKALVNGEYSSTPASSTPSRWASPAGCSRWITLGWGTPDDLATFEYWQSCFHK